MLISTKSVVILFRKSLRLTQDFPQLIRRMFLGFIKFPELKTQVLDITDVDSDIRNC